MNTIKMIYDSEDKFRIKTDDIRSEAIDFVHDSFDFLCDEEQVDVFDLVELIETYRKVKTAKYTDDEPKLITSYENATSEDSLCWVEDVAFYPANGSEYTDPTESGNDEIYFNLMRGFNFCGYLVTYNGNTEMKDKFYNRIVRDKDGLIEYGLRIWTGGKMPTIEQRKAAEWDGMEAFVNGRKEQL